MQFQSQTPSSAPLLFDIRFRVQTGNASSTSVDFLLKFAFISFFFAPAASFEILNKYALVSHARAENWRLNSPFNQGDGGEIPASNIKPLPFTPFPARTKAIHLMNFSPTHTHTHTRGKRHSLVTWAHSEVGPNANFARKARSPWVNFSQRRAFLTPSILNGTVA